MRIFKRDGSTNWWASWYDQKGRRHRKSTRTVDKKLAEAMAAKWKQESFMEEHFGTIPDTPFHDALVRYAEEKQRQNPDGYEVSLKYQLQKLLDYFDKLKLKDIDSRVLHDYAALRRRTIKEATLHRELAVIQAIMNKSKREGLLANAPSFPKVKLPKGRTRWLTMDEEKRLLNASPDHLKLVIMFALDTGGRRSELFKLDWRNVDLDHNRIVFVETKNGEDRAVRLTDRARAILEHLGPNDCGPVFTYKGKVLASVTSSFERARRIAGMEDVRFHDLRHTFASRLVQRGVPLYEVMQLTGHKSLVMVQRYAHLAPEFQERAIGALNDVVGRAKDQKNGCWHVLDTADEKSGNLKKCANENPLISHGVGVVEPDGIEPTTSTMPL